METHAVNEMPVVRVAAYPSHIFEAAPTQNKEKSMAEPIRCLIAQKQTEQLKSFKDLLLEAIEQPFDCFEVDNLPSLVQALSSYRPGLLFLDWHLTGLPMQDSDLADILIIERIEAWRLKSPGLRVLAMTRQPAEGRHALDLGVDAVLSLNDAPLILKARLMAFLRACRIPSFRYN
jgi:DNA-binding response OmpR family regulator